MDARFGVQTAFCEIMWSFSYFDEEFKPPLVDLKWKIYVIAKLEANWLRFPDIILLLAGLRGIV